MDISVVIVSYNVKEFLQQCIFSLRKSLENYQAEIIVVDNNSVDGTGEILKRSFPDVRLFENEENVGFAAGCNQGLEVASGKYFLLLNPDTIIQEDTIPTMIDFFEEHPDSGAAGCRILNADGTLQLACRRSFPTPWVAFTKLIGLSSLFPRSRRFGRYNLTYLNPNEMAQVESISGSFLMFRREIFEKIGGLDETYFMYGEDIDYCFRIRQEGWNIYYVPDTKIIHYKGESTKLASFDNFIAFYQAMDIFVKKHFKSTFSLFLDIIIRIGILFRGVISFFGRIFHKQAVPIVDGILLILSILTVHQLQPRPLPSYPTLIYMLIFYLALWLGTGYAIGLYERRELLYSRAAVASVISFIASVIFNFLFKDFIYSPHQIIWSFITVMIFLPGWRLFLIILQRRRIIKPASLLSRALLSRRTILVGTGKEGERIARKLQTHIEHGFEILGFADKKFVYKTIAGFPFLGLVNDLPELVRIHRATEIIFTTDQFSNDEILHIIDKVKHVRANIKIVPKNVDYILGKSSVEKIENIPLIDVEYNILHVGNRISKRLFDICVSVIGIIVLTPFIVPAAFMSRYRLRKMEYLGVESRTFTGWQFVKNNGNHGRDFIRKFPLLGSVIRGNMSIVGNELLSANPNTRHLRCKPGLTGLSQLQENHQPDEKVKQNYEYYYMLNHSFFLDIEIILKAMLKI